MAARVALLHAGTAQRCLSQLSTEEINEDKFELSRAERTGRRNDALRQDAASEFVIMPATVDVQLEDSLSEEY